LEEAVDLSYDRLLMMMIIYIYIYTYTYTYFCLAFTSLVSSSRFILEVTRSHTRTHHIRWDSSGRVIGPSQRPLLDKHTTLTTGKHPRRRRDSNPKSQQSRDEPPTNEQN
jgi:hypothetical protein